MPKSNSMPPCAPGYDAYPAPQAGCCAAGKFCTAPEHTKLPDSFHHCFNCGGRFHSELWCAIKFERLKQKTKMDHILKNLLSPTAFKRWMNEHDILKEKAEDDGDPSRVIADSDIEERLADMTICNSCVHHYRKLVIKEVLESSSESEDEVETATAPSAAQEATKPSANNGGKAVDGAGGGSGVKKKRGRKAKKQTTNVQLDLSIHPVSVLVPWDHIAHYPESQLTAANFCSTSRAGDQNWPLTLTCMTVGIEEIGDVEKDVDLLNVIKPNSCKLYNKSQVFPSSRSVREVLQKELARRIFVESPGEKDRAPRCKNYTSPQLIEALKGFQHTASDKAFIIAAWNDFKAGLRDHFLSKSNTQEAEFFRKLRLIEAILHPELMDAFKQRNRQLQAHEIDARNSDKSSPTYYDKVAALYNSDEVLSSVAMGTEYGSPFEVAVQLKQPTKSITGADVKQYILSLKRPFIWIDSSIRQSGSGDSDPRGSEVKQFCSEPRKDANGNMMALGDIMGYAFKRCKQESAWDSITATLDGEYAGTMNANPQIKTPRNNTQASKKRAAKSSSKSSSRKKRSKCSGESEGYSSDEEGDPKVNLLNRIAGNQERSSLETKISEVRLAINEDEKLVVMLRESTKTSRAELRTLERELVKDGINEEDFSTDKWWRDANEEYETTKAEIADIKARISESKQRLDNLTSQLNSGWDEEGSNSIIASPNRTPRSRARRQSKSALAYHLFELDEDKQMGSLAGSDDDLSVSYEPEQIGSDEEEDDQE